MEKFISYTIKERLTFLLAIIVMPAIAIWDIIDREFPITFDFFLIIAFCYSFKEKISSLYKYKIEDNALIIKKILKIETYNFDELEKILFPVPSKKDTFIFKFSQKNINIFYDKNIAQLIEYFFKNNIEKIYEKKKKIFENTKCFINISNETPSRHRRIKLLIIFIISLLCSIDLFFERKNEIGYYIVMVSLIVGAMVCAIACFIAFFKSFKEVEDSELENEYIDKNGFHLLDLFIPFSETEEIVKVIKRWGIIKLKIKTKKNEEYEISTFGFYGDILYEMYLKKKIGT